MKQPNQLKKPDNGGNHQQDNRNLANRLGNPQIPDKPEDEIRNNRKYNDRPQKRSSKHGEIFTSKSERWHLNREGLMKERRPFNYWDMELEHLEVPMISPHLIPVWCVQSWDYVSRKWVLVARNGQRLWIRQLGFPNPDILD